jgi:serine protease Do
LSELSGEQKAQLQIEAGLLIEDVKGVAAKSELHRGDIILAINNAVVTSVDQFNELLKHLPKGRNVALLVRRGEMTSYVALKLDEK